MPLSPSAPQRMERSNPHFANEQLMDRRTRIQILKPARFMQLDLPSWSDAVQESTSQNTKGLCVSLAAPGLPAALCSPAPTMGCATRPSGPCLTPAWTPAGSLQLTGTCVYTEADYWI